MGYVGLRWYKCDFHLHTMCSACYREKKDTPSEWVEEVKRKGLQCIAITDHNDYRGIDEIKAICEGEGIVVFPAVELSCDSSKIHILILFDVHCEGADVRDFLAKVGITKNELGNSANTSNGSIFEICDMAQKAGALVIAAHIDDYSGISQISHDNIKKVLDRKYINAVQIVNKSVWDVYENNKDIKETCRLLSEKYDKEISDDKAKEWYKAYSLAKEAGLPFLTFSDNPCSEKDAKHGLWGIGRNYSWLKMDQKPNLESVRQALLSYDMRVRNEYESPNKPDAEPELWIKSIKATDTLLNKKEDIIVDFNPQLNTIIGGRGSGKSSIIRMLVGGMCSFGGDNLEEIKNEQYYFYRESKKEKGKGIARGVFTKNSTLEIYFERLADSYKLVVTNISSMSNQSRKLYKYVNESWSEVVDDNFLNFFKAQAYTQKEIYELALDANSLLSIIDEDIADLSKKINEKDTIFNSYIAKSLEIYDLKKSISEESRINTELKDIEEQISKYESSGISDALREKEKYSAQKKIIDDYIKQKSDKVTELKNSIMSLELVNPNLSEMENPELELLLDKDQKAFLIRKNALLESIRLLDEDTDSLLEEIDKSEWKKGKESAENQYNKVCKELQEQGIDFDKLDELLDRKKNKLTELDNIKSDKAKLGTAEETQKLLYGQYERAANEIWSMRADFINGVIGKGSNVKFVVKKGRNKTSFVNMMKSVLQKDNATIDDEISKLSTYFFEKDGMKKFRELMQDIRDEKDKKTCQGRMNSAIRDMTPEAFSRMIAFIPEDDLEVSYKPEGAKKFIPLSNASAGQKTTAILTFLLAYGDLPLLLDQPEDDLDNKLVYDLVVARLKEAKSKRQVIVVTHNANIPVNADAEYIVSMNSETDDVKVRYEGTMDDKKIGKEICDVMEGTKYAFEMRAKKYHFHIVE